MKKSCKMAELQSSGVRSFCNCPLYIVHCTLSTVGAITPAKLNSAVKFAAIDSGYIHHGSSSSGWTLHEGNGERAYTANITFNHPFEKAPRMIVSRFYKDIRGNADQKFLISPKDITKNGFKLVFRT